MSLKLYRFFSIDLALSKALFKAVDRNGNGELDLTDVMALAAILNKLNARFGSKGNPAAPAAAQNVL